MSKWIKCSDRLPEKLKRVLVFDDRGFGVLSGRLGSAGWYLEETLDIHANITHWQPLPEPPTN